ncbi:hypothetical protein JOB18_049667 [Solea senegalensis]|uniref:Uncharacterized protein n=1 Tax=Solea senegalensis TaxID=28829 RepID=A0AAV6T295_SOLSE|nr:hypothetical protein JOB18_049667 [Solea senegalensis]
MVSFKGHASKKSPRSYRLTNLMLWWRVRHFHRPQVICFVIPCNKDELPPVNLYLKSGFPRARKRDREHKNRERKLKVTEEQEKEKILSFELMPCSVDLSRAKLK